MLAAEMSALELGRRLGCDANEVRELLDPLHRSHIEQVEAALRVLGKRIEVLVLEAI
jgi:antitoxin HicB